MVRKAVGQVNLVEALLPAAFGSNQRLERIRVRWTAAGLGAAAAAAPDADGAACLPAAGPAQGAPAPTPARSADRACSAAGLAVPAGRQGYRLSDRDLEEALVDRLSFFCGLGLEDAVPDATTLSCFRIDLAEAVFDVLNRQLEQRGLVVKAGFDATLVEAEVKRPPMREGEVSERDPAAGFTRRGQRSFFGTKAHLAVGRPGRGRHHRPGHAPAASSQAHAGLAEMDERGDRAATCTGVCATAG
jgi:hypothetical protein